MSVSISDHALIRWLERAYGMDFQPYRDELAGLCEPFVAVGAKNPLIAPGLYAVTEGRIVKSIVPSKPVEKRGPVAKPEPLHWKARTRRRPHK